MEVHIDFQLWRLWAATLAYSYFYCLTVDHQNAPVNTPIPAIYCILGAPAKRPSREIQFERWYGLDEKDPLLTDLVSLSRSFSFVHSHV